MARWAGIIGSALKGAAEVAVPAALAKTADERRARLQQLRDQALFAQQRSMAAQEYAFRGAEGEANRGLQRDLGERNIGLIESRMGQEADRFSQEFRFRQQQHADDVRLADEKLQLLRESGGDGGAVGKEQALIMYFQNNGYTFDESLDKTKDILGRTDDLEQTLLLQMMSDHKSNFLTADKPFDVKAAVSEAKDIARQLRGDQKTSGGGGMPFQSPDDVRAAFQRGEISKEDAYKELDRLGGVPGGTSKTEPKAGSDQSARPAQAPGRQQPEAEPEPEFTGPLFSMRPSPYNEEAGLVENLRQKFYDPAERALNQAIPGRARVTGAAPGTPQNPIRIANPAEIASLASGTWYVDPADGSVKQAA